MTMPETVEAGFEPSNENTATEQVDADLVATETGKIPSKLEAEVAPEPTPADVPAAAAPAPENLAAANGTGETALDNTTYNNDTGNEEKGEEDQPSPLTANEDTDGHAGGDATDNDVDLIAVAALAIPHAVSPPQYTFDVSTLPVLSPLITRKDISRRDLPLICHVVGCNLGLGPQAEYYQRYRICKEHLRSTALLVDGDPQRFCQQCGKFHDLDAFDGDKRNCRARLAQHNSRRRKAGAGNTPTLMSYGQGGSGRKRIPTSFEGFNMEYDFDYPISGESRKKRARIPVSKDFPPLPKSQRTSRPPKHLQDHIMDEEDNGFLDQLLAAANGLEEEEQRSEEEQHHHRQGPRGGGAEYYNQAGDEPYTYDPNAAMHHAAPPPRLTSRPVEEEPGRQYNKSGSGRSMAGAAGQHQNGGAGGYGQFNGGWAGHGGAGGGSGGYLPVHHPSQMPYGVPPPAVGAAGPAAVSAAVSELERVMGRQLLQSLMAGAGLPAAMLASPPPPPPPLQQPGGQQLLDMLRAMTGGAGTPPGAAASYYPGVQQPAVYQPQTLYAQPAAAPLVAAATAGAATSPAAALASLLGAAETQPDRAQNALEALRKLVSTLPDSNGVAAPAPAAPAAAVEPVVIKTEPVVAAAAAPTSANLIEQLAEALKVQNEATNAAIGHQAAAALLGTGGEPSVAAAVVAAAAREPSPAKSVASLTQQDVMRRLMAMLENTKSAAAKSPPQSPPPAAAAAEAPEAAAAAAAATAAVGGEDGSSPELLASLVQQAEAAAVE